MVDNSYVRINKLVNQREDSFSIDGKHPFSILLLGVDTGEYDRTEQGRSDTIMLATVNPKTKTTSLLSIPRDTRMPIIGKDMDDKVNHAYAFGGPEMSINSLSNYLQVPIDYFVSIDMKGLARLVDRVGGVNVDNQLAFKQGKYEFPLGLIHLNGKQALEYVRMRYDDPNNDYGRQERQRKVVQALTNELISAKFIVNYSKILSILDSSLQTNLSVSDLQAIALKHYDCFKNQETEQLQAKEQIIDGISYQVPEQQELDNKRQLLKKQLEIP